MTDFLTPNKKIAIVYDWIDSWGGVERVLLTLHELIPEADFYTSYYDPDKAPWAKSLRIHTSFIQKLPGFIKKNRTLSIPFYPYAFESFDFNGYDLVISISSSFAKGIITRAETLHIAYLLSPTRFLWSHTDEYMGTGIKHILFSPFAEKLRVWDKVVSQRPDKMISISNVIADRCKKYYGRSSEVIYPPFDVDYWENQSKLSQKPSIPLPQNYYLIVSRLETYKKVDLAVRVFNMRPQDTLVIVGTGREEQRLKNIANKNILFLRSLSDAELAHIYQNATALIMPQEEDFGYVALEAQYFGCPVIAYRAGGALETVIEGKTGVFFDEQTEHSLEVGLEKHHTISYNIKVSLVQLKNSLIEKYSKDNFVAKFKNTIINNLSKNKI